MLEAPVCFAHLVAATSLQHVDDDARPVFKQLKESENQNVSIAKVAVSLTSRALVDCGYKLRVQE